MQKIGLLGGTFDPIHKGHVQLAQIALAEVGLSKVLLIPAADPPHKEKQGVSAYFHRQAMVSLALEGQDGLELCLIEGDLPQPSYTIGTIRHLIAESDGRDTYLFIVGIDSFADLLTWKEYREILRTVSLVVAVRHGFDGWSSLAGIASLLGYSTGMKNVWRSISGLMDIYFLEGMPVEISSSAIRKALSAGHSGIDGLPQGVEEYIRYHHLYDCG